MIKWTTFSAKYRNPIIVSILLQMLCVMIALAIFVSARLPGSRIMMSAFSIYWMITVIILFMNPTAPSRFQLFFVRCGFIMFFVAFYFVMR